MPAPQLLTYRDAISAANDFVGGLSTGVAQGDIRRAIHVAYREIGDAFSWSFLKKQGRVPLQALESTGTVAYDHTGGSNERQLTLTPVASEVWPSWAVDATVRVGSVPCRVESRISDTVLTLDVNLNPGADVAASTAFQIYPACYTLPHDFESLVQPWGEDTWRFGQQVSRDEILALDRFRETTGGIRCFAVGEVADLQGSLGLYIHPASDATETLDFLYRRRARQLRYSGHDAAETDGTITVNVDSTAVVGVGTAFDAKMVGSTLRVGTGGTNVPTGLDGLYPYDDERIIAGHTDATNVTLDTAITTARSGVKYCISDAIDLHAAAHNAFLACVTKHLAVSRNMKHKAEMIALYDDALMQARGADHRVTQRRVAGRPTVRRVRLADYPMGTDVE
ncbi:hypothetical protein LCGC14_1147520 [marine sediment metagenome]|uniref:Uncharacterized protein n=1 Tax=marine sediment metagenome TaxID=412755 RepID=A0A0F9PEL3_9ZZZZ|nr:hypothetical protein [Phycisphaerae bacterium]HDZ44732.1 hypothetical protein [Phycisphaerae bacterium]